MNLLFCPCFLFTITKLIGIQARHVIKVDILVKRESGGRGGFDFAPRGLYIFRCLGISPLISVPTTV